MSVPRIFVAPNHIHGSIITIQDPAQIHHLRKVLRLCRGDHVVCLDGQGAGYQGTVRSVTARGLEVQIKRIQQTEELQGTLWLGQALPKGNRIDWLIQKATELGITRLTPVVTQRTASRLSHGLIPQRWQRWQRIAQQAAQQSGRSRLPIIDAPQPLREFLRALPSTALIVMATLVQPTRPLREVLASAKTFRHVVILIGPEGDFSPEEVAEAIASGAQPVSLGSLTLRTETAAVATTAIVNFVLQVT